MRAAFIGSGNVATHMALRLKEAGCDVVCIYSRTLEHAQSLASKAGCKATCNPAEVPEADIYICSVKDDNIADAVKGIAIPSAAILVHTAGSVEMSVLAPFTANIGVIYPMQTFSKSKSVNWSEIPLFIEANNNINLQKLLLFAKSISPKLSVATSAQRKILHLASVFACNFTNEIYAIADRLLRENGMELSTLYPLIDETVAKIKVMHPAAAQTGPAKRCDSKVMAMQENLLSGTDREVYRILSEAIQNELEVSS